MRSAWCAWWGWRVSIGLRSQNPTLVEGAEVVFMTTDTNDIGPLLQEHAETTLAQPKGVQKTGGAKLCQKRFERKGSWDLCQEEFQPGDRVRPEDSFGQKRGRELQERQGESTRVYNNLQTTTCNS